MSQLNVWGKFPYNKNVRVYRVDWIVVSTKDQRSNALWPSPIWITNEDSPTWKQVIENCCYAKIELPGLLADGDTLTVRTTNDRNTIEKWVEENYKYGGEIRDTRTERSPHVNIL